MKHSKDRETAKQLFATLLNNHDTDGTEENELIKFLDCSSVDLLEDFFLRSTTIKQYRAFSFIVDEGYFSNCNNLLPLLKLVQSRVDDGYTNYFILPRYIELSKTKEDMQYVVDRLIGKVEDRLLPNLYWGVGYMSDIQLEILASFGKIDGYPLYLFSKKTVKNIDFFKKEILNKDKFYQDIVFLSAFTKGFIDNELSELIDIADNDDLKSWYCLSPTRPVAPNTKKGNR